MLSVPPVTIWLTGPGAIYHVPISTLCWFQEQRLPCCTQDVSTPARIPVRLGVALMGGSLRSETYQGSTLAPVLQPSIKDGYALGNLSISCMPLT